MRRVATRRYVFAHREASRFHRISKTHKCSDPSARLGRHLSQRSKGAATTPTTRRGPAGRAVINDRALLDARSQMRSREERTRAPVRPASVALLVPVVSGGVQIA